jgi:hypothetical protein
MKCMYNQSTDRSKLDQFSQEIEYIQQWKRSAKEKASISIEEHQKEEEHLE